MGAFDFMIKAPVAELHFTEPGNSTTGFVSEWSAAPMHRFYTDIDLSAFALPKGSYVRRTTNNGAFYYFTSYGTALEASRLVNRKFPPDNIWRWETPVSQILNLSDEVRARFGDVMSMEAQMTVMTHRKQRHEFNMLLLPSAVQALALLAGHLAEPIFDYTSLRVDDAAIDAAYQHRVIGDGETYAGSELWQARTRLWSALGEADPIKSFNGSSIDTTAPRLAECLGIVISQVQTWAQLTSVPDPRVDAVTKDGKRLTLPVVLGIWPNKNAAIAALGLDPKPSNGHAPAAVNGHSNGTNGHSNGHSNGHAPANGTNGSLPVPVSWGGYVNEWKQEVVSLKNSYEGQPKPVVVAALRQREAELASTYSASVDEILAWWDQV
jgi:hypothetical protein